MCRSGGSELTGCVGAGAVDSEIIIKAPHDSITIAKLRFLSDLEKWTPTSHKQPSLRPFQCTISRTSRATFGIPAHIKYHNVSHSIPEMVFGIVTAETILIVPFLKTICGTECGGILCDI